MFSPKKNVRKQDQIDQTLNFKTMSVTKNLYWFTLWLQQKYHFLTKTRSYFSISILLSKTFGHVVNFNCCINRVVEKLINLKLIYWSFQMWLLIIWGTNWTQWFHWFKRGWLITHHDGKDASKASILWHIAILFGQLTNLVVSPSVWLFVVTARWC